MKRSPSADLEVNKRIKSDYVYDCPGSRQEKEGALARFAQLKAARSRRDSVEFSEVCTILNKLNLYRDFRPIIESYMPEIHCILKEMIKHESGRRSFIGQMVRLVIHIQELKALRQRSSEAEALLCQEELARKAAGFVKGDIGSNTVMFKTKLKELQGRDHPSYIGVLPEAVLGNIVRRLNVKDALPCLRTCRSLRTTTLKGLKWKAIIDVPPYLALNPIDGSPDMINTLPVELLSEAFSYLGTSDLLSCHDVCKRWRQIVENGSSQYFDDVNLLGDLRLMDSQWAKVRRLLHGRSPSALSMQHQEEISRWRCGAGLEEKDDRQWHEFDLSKTFPYKTLQDFYYEADATSILDQEIWKKLHQCTQLKSLGICIGETTDYHCHFDVPMESKLAKCRLDRFSLASLHEYGCGPLSLDRGMLALLSAVKSITIDFNCTSDDLYEVLRSTRDTLEELDLRCETARGEFDDQHLDLDGDEEGEGHIVQWRGVELPRLIAFSGYLPTYFKLETPRLKKLDLQVLGTPDINFLSTVGQSLKSFTCEFDPGTSKRGSEPRILLPSMLREVLKLSACHTLSLPSNGIHSYYALNKSERNDNLQDFWFKMLPDPAALPSLKHFTIKGPSSKDFACCLSATKLLSWLQERIVHGHALDTLVLIDVDSFEVTTIAQLGQIVPNLTFRTIRR